MIIPFEVPRRFLEQRNMGKVTKIPLLFFTLYETVHVPDQNTISHLPFVLNGLNKYDSSPTWGGNY